MKVVIAISKAEIVLCCMMMLRLGARWTLGTRRRQIPGGGATEHPRSALYQAQLVMLFAADMRQRGPSFTVDIPDPIEFITI